MGQDCPDCPGCPDCPVSLSATVWIQLILLLLALTVLLGAVVARARQRRRTVRYFRDRLASPDPAVRASAVRAWATFGLYRCAADLLATFGVESDPQVRCAIVEAVRSRAWEPDSRPEIGELRARCAQFQQDHGDADASS